VCAFSGKLHFQFSFIVWLLIQVGVDHVFLNPIPFLIASVFPDCDIRTSPMGRVLPLWLIFNHRGFTHTLGGLLVFSLPIGIFYSWKWCFLFAGGYFLHLMMDSGTPMGVKWIKGHKRRKRIKKKSLGAI
jgi:membrane-bound metal-dependent hydrolase YbcI (DUF457 family)